MKIGTVKLLVTFLDVLSSKTPAIVIHEAKSAM